MNVLADRHHAGLFHSLQLLFEDRLGGTLYTPVGHEWWDEGYWRFGEVYGDDRLARQYLEPNGWTQTCCTLVAADPEFPERPLMGIRLADAGQMKWDAVVATVQENQQGLARFAREHGAKFVVQVGNTGQRIDWDLDPLVVNSSEMPILGRGVRIGQEFDHAGMFRYTPPASRESARSFVNCMPDIAECWAGLVELRQNLPDWTWGIHGIDGPDGNVKPIAMTASLMKASGWALHDKRQGDGYGHVLHYWASVGRPLVGHASHYARKNGARYWRDLETCIDLDRRSVPEAAGLMREIAADPDAHDAMCRAIRRELEADVDWEGDAEKVRALLS